MPLLFRKKTQDVPRRRQDGGLAGDARREAAAERESTTSFRRNRTLTGSLSSRVSSVNEQGADLQSTRTQAHHLTRQRRKVSSVLIGVVGAALICSGLMYQMTARPIVSSTDGSIALDAKRYENAIDEYLTRHPAERLRFITNSERLQEYMTRTLPEVAMIKPEGFAGLGASNFTIVLRKPIASWLIGQTQYFVDASGVPFRTNYYDVPSVRIVDESGIQQTAGTAVASSRFLNFVGRSVAIAHDYNITVEQAIIPPNTTRQVQLRIAGHGYPIKLSLDRPVGEQVEDMQRAVAYLNSKKLKPQYVDVRVSGKAYYK